MGLGTSRNFLPSRTVDRTQGPPVDRTQGPLNQRIELPDRPTSGDRREGDGTSKSIEREKRTEVHDRITHR